MRTGFEIAGAVLKEDPVPKGGPEKWAEFCQTWQRYQKPGVCCFCLQRALVCDPVRMGLDKLEFRNFTDFPRRLASGTAMCFRCFSVLKEYAFLNPALVYFLTPSSVLRKQAPARFAADNVSVFDIRNAAGREAFLMRLLDPPDEPFVCGRKPAKTHAVPFSPVNAPRARIVQVLWGVDKTMPVVFFDRERHGPLADEARAYWATGRMPERLGSYRGLPLYDMLVALTKPGRQAPAQK